MGLTRGEKLNKVNKGQEVVKKKENFGEWETLRGEQGRKTGGKILGTWYVHDRT